MVQCNPFVIHGDAVRDDKIKSFVKFFLLLSA